MVVTVNNKEGEPLREPEKALGEDQYPGLLTNR